MKSLTEKVHDLEKEIDKLKNKSVSPLEEIILKSDYRILTFFGVASGTILAPTALTPNFNQSIVLEKNLIIKSIKVIPYADANVVDIRLDDGVTVATETLVQNTRINRVFDTFAAGLNLQITINGEVIPIVPIIGTGDFAVPLDLFVDNIYYIHRYKIQSITVNAAAQIDSDLTGTLDAPRLYVLIECYVYDV